MTGYSDRRPDESAPVRIEAPPLVAGDFERGVLPAQLFGTTVFPHAMAFGATGKLAYAEEFGRITAQESRALGVHWNLFPVADVNSNPANPIIGTPAFGENPAAGRRPGSGLHPWRTRGRNAHDRQALSRTRQHGHRLRTSPCPTVGENLAQLNAVDLPPSARPSRPVWTPS